MRYFVKREKVCEDGELMFNYMVRDSEHNNQLVAEIYSIGCYDAEKEAEILCSRLNDNKLRIKTIYRSCEFDIHGAMMDANLGNYGEIILGLLEEGYGFKSEHWDKGKKWIVKKERNSLKPDELLITLNGALTLIFKLLNDYRNEITK
jgi:hypothetical protein